MIVNTNHIKVYELHFNDISKDSRNTLITNIILAIANKTTVTNQRGTFYVKQILSCTNSDILLFGKDNEDASNYKREKDSLIVEKIDINETTEVLTDFIHVGISKKHIYKKGKKQGFVVFIEKSSLINSSAVEDYIDHLLSSALATTLRRRVSKDFIALIENASRILEVQQIKINPDVPIVPTTPLIDGNRNIENEGELSDTDDIEVTENIILTPKKRGGSIPLEMVKKIIGSFDKTDVTSRLLVNIVDSHKNTIPLDFNKIESEYSIKYSMPINQKKDIIQEDIKDKINHFIKLDLEGDI